MIVIENLPFTKVDIPECLLSRLPIRDSYVVFLLTSLSDKVSGGRRKGRRHKSTVYTIKSLLTDYGSSSQQLLTKTLILKDPIYSKQSNQLDVINTE